MVCLLFPSLDNTLLYFTFFPFPCVYYLFPLFYFRFLILVSLTISLWKYLYSLSLFLTFFFWLLFHCYSIFCLFSSIVFLPVILSLVFFFLLYFILNILCLLFLLIATGQFLALFVNDLTKIDFFVRHCQNLRIFSCVNGFWWIWQLVKTKRQANFKDFKFLFKFFI
jgi:hypothetical protein